MKSKTLLAVAGMLVAGPLFAQSTATTTSTASSASFFKKLQDSPLSFSFNLETDTARAKDTNEVKGAKQINRFYLGYKLSDKDKLRAEVRTTHQKVGDNPTDNSTNRTVLKYTRSKLLTEAENGVDMKFDVEYRYLPDKNVRNSANRYSHVRVGPTVAKSFGNLSADAGLFYAINQTRNRNEANRDISNIYVPFSQSYKLNSKLTAVLVEEFFWTQTASGVGESETLDLTLEVGQQFTKAFYAGLSASGTTYKLTDGVKQRGAYSWTEQLTYGINFNFDVF